MALADNHEAKQRHCDAAGAYCQIAGIKPGTHSLSLTGLQKGIQTHVFRGVTVALQASAKAYRRGDAGGAGSNPAGIQPCGCSSVGRAGNAAGSQVRILPPTSNNPERARRQSIAGNPDPCSALRGSGSPMMSAPPAARIWASRRMDTPREQQPDDGNRHRITASEAPTAGRRTRRKPLPRIGGAGFKQQERGGNDGKTPLLD